MKKISLLLTFLLVFSLALPAFAETEIEFDGGLWLTFDEFTEVDGNPWYSMNGNTNIFGTGDWKQSTTDNPNDNREKFESKILLNTKITVDDTVTINAGFESLTDEFNGYPNGTGATRVQETPTVRDNSPVQLRDLTLTADTKYAKIIATNNFNYNFNERVLATQFEDNWGEMTPYGEGILVQTDIAGVATQGFVFQTSKGTPGTASSAGDDIIVNEHDTFKKADKLIYGADLKKDLAKGKLGALIINTHDKSSDEQGENFDKDLDNLHLVINGDYYLTDKVTLNGEFITAKYGDDVTEVINVQNIPWHTPAYDLSGQGAKEDTDIFEVGATVNPLPNLKVNTFYKNVGEDYIAVIGADHDMDSWFGDANFNYGDGTGYEKGLGLNASYDLKTMFNPTVTLDLTNYEMTRSQLNGDEDDTETEVEAGVSFGDGPWSLGASYRVMTRENDNFDVDMEYNDFNVNGSYKLVDDERLTADLHGDINYYTGDDKAIDQNFSTETRFKVGAGSSYKLNEFVTLTTSYDFGYATEDNDVIKDASGRQHLIKLGASYKITENSSFSLMYKYDNYNLDRDATADDLVNSVYKKEAEHQWYDGAESWEHGPENYAWNNWPNTSTIAPNYSGYTTHEIKATYNVNF
ncbi:porin family protein [Orenia marismortui]|uniref:porin n=1 Tax=Orenia marismortui TaxID=46469 RepID=UPI00035F4573|nr:porin [Orenia marismortui]